MAIKTYEENGSDDNPHNGKTGVILVGFNTGTGTITLSHKVGTEDVTIDTFTASGGSQFVSPLGVLKVTASGLSGDANITVNVAKLNEH